MILKKLAFTMLALSLTCSLHAQPHENTYIQKNPYVMQLLQKAGLSVGREDGKTFQSMLFDAKKNQRVNPSVIKELESIYKLFYVENLPAPTSPKEVINKGKALNAQSTLNAAATNMTDNFSGGIEEQSALERQATEPHQINNIDSMNNSAASNQDGNNQVNKEKLEQARALINEVESTL